MIIFSKIKLTAGDNNAEGLVSGQPQTSRDLDGWRIWEDFVKNIGEAATVTVNVQSYGYGEGEAYVATPEEVAYMVQRISMRPNFLESRCSDEGSYTFTVQLNPEKMFGLDALYSVVEDYHPQSYRDKMLELVDDGLLSARTLALMCLKWMSEDDIKEMADANEIEVD